MPFTMSTTNSSQLELSGVTAVAPTSPLEATREAEGNGGHALPMTTDGHRVVAASKTTAFRERRAAAPAKVDDNEGGVEALLTFAEAAKALGISLRQFRRLVDGGKLAFVRVSERSPRIRPGELRRYLDASVVKHTEA